MVTTKHHVFEIDNLSRFQTVDFEDLVDLIIFFYDSAMTEYKTQLKICGVKNVFLKDVITDLEGDIPTLKPTIYEYLVYNDIL